MPGSCGARTEALAAPLGGEAVQQPGAELARRPDQHARHLGGLRRARLRRRRYEARRLVRGGLDELLRGAGVAVDAPLLGVDAIDQRLSPPAAGNARAGGVTPQPQLSGTNALRREPRGCVRACWGGAGRSRGYL
jgi:hypothetical protein